jgi:GntR family transcriptional regulator/MocR family aminotransferase
MGWLADGTDDVAMSHRAAAVGVNCRPLSLCRHKRTGRAGLMLGYAAFTPVQIREAVKKLARSLSHAYPRRAGLYL